MDDMSEIENRMKEVVQVVDSAPAPAAPENAAVPAVVENAASIARAETGVPVTAALEEVAANIVSKAQERINSEKTIEKNARALAKNAAERIENEIDRQNVENEKKKASNQIDRKELSNKLYIIRQESKRLKKEQRHLSKMQKSEQKTEKSHSYWVSHSKTLEQYGMHEGSSRVACEILLWLDGIKCFFNGLSKVSNAIIKSLKFVLIFGFIFAALMIVPATREWLLSLMGFIKK